MNSAIRKIISNPNILISPVELAAAIKEQSSVSGEFVPRIVPIDASWYMPGNERNGFKEYIDKRIPGSVFFDLDVVKDKESEYPHMLPKNGTEFWNDFGKALLSAGYSSFSPETLVVIYDKVGNFSAPRAQWTFEAFGHVRSKILDNYLDYEYLKYPLVGGELKSMINKDKIKFSTIDINTNCSPNKDLVISYEELFNYVKSGNNDWTIIDARSNGRFDGTVDEPRKGISSGHIPRAKNLPFEKVLDPVSKKFLPSEIIKNILANSNIPTSKPIIVMCGTGVTACIIRTALLQCGITNVRVYDGSWTEWAQRAPKEFIVKS